MMISSQVIRQVALCYSSYFFSLARGNADYNTVWEKLLKQNGDAFAVLREALQAIDSSSITEQPHCAVQVMTSLIQLQRFDDAILNFHNCHAHLNAALALFQQLLESSGSITSPRSLFKAACAASVRRQRPSLLHVLRFLVLSRLRFASHLPL
jgi:hypothetical protein